MDVVERGDGPIVFKGPAQSGYSYAHRMEVSRAVGRVS